MENNNDIVKKYLTEKRRKWTRYLTGIGVALLTIVTTYLVHTSPTLNLADLTAISSPLPGDTEDVIYMPNYTGGIGESGELEIKTKHDVVSMDSITFTLNYSPVNALSFDSNPIVLDAGTEFQDVAFNMTASPEAGKLIVTIILDDPIALSAGDTLFKLHTQISSDLPEGQVINVSFDDFAVLDGVNAAIPSGTASSVMPDMPASTITVQGDNNLKVLSAQAIDSTHVAVHFSDILSDIGNNSHYSIIHDPDTLAVSAVQSGTAYGYGQDYVVLTTASQTANYEYAVSVVIDPLAPVEGNEDKQVNAQYATAVFYGYGIDTLSDFGMTGATVSGYNTVTVTFSDDVEAASVTKTDFVLKDESGSTLTINNVSSVTDNQVVLSVAQPLLKRTNYLLNAVSSSSVLRDSDSAELGMDHIAFTGLKDGPRLIAATVIDDGGTYKARFTFDENIQLGGVANNPVGKLYLTEAGAIAIADPIDDSNLATYNQTISGTTLTIESPIFNDADANFTFALWSPDWLTNSQGVSVDSTYKSISFWGYGHNASTNSVGTVDVTKRDVILVPDGTLDFSQVTVGDVSVLYDNGLSSNLQSAGLTSVSMVGDDLEVVMNDSLDPANHYILRITDGASTLAAKDFVVARALNIESAEAISSNQLRVYFSENIDERDGTGSYISADDFTLSEASGASITIEDSLVIDSGYQSVTLTRASGSFSASEIYKIALSNPTAVYAYSGNYSLKRLAYFTGYGTLAAQSPVTLDTVTVLNSKTLRFEFSDAINQASFTPVNMNIFYFLSPSATEGLTVNSVTRISDTVYELTTASQVSGQNYFVTFNGVKDSDGLLLGNTKPASFLGYTLPEIKVSLVTPSVMANEVLTNIVLSGQNMDLVSEVRVGNQVMTIVSQTATSLVFEVPEGFDPDLYHINLIDSADNSTLFENALLVTVPEQELTVHSDQSKSIPLNVPNDGTTPVTLWLLVEDPVGLASISSVTADLSQIGGPSVVEMTKDTGTQPQNSQWYTYDLTVPATVGTKADPYLIPVEVRKGSDVYNGSISVHVTNDVVQSVPPTIDNLYISPVAVAPDASTPVRISAQVSDEDGAHTINSVVADLGALGIGFVTLSPVSEITEGTELETQFYQSEEFTVPLATDEGDYTISVTASDKTGESVSSTLEFTVSTSANGPTISSDLSYISPRSSVPNDGKTSFDLNVFVSDVDGSATILDVTARFGTIGLPPIKLTRDTADAAAGGGFSAWYYAKGLTIPTTSPLGVHDINIVATDVAGGVGSLNLRLDVTHKDTLGDPPRVVADRAYTTPRVTVNDGETPVTLYAFVQDDDDDVESVIVNLSTIGQVGSQSSGTLGSTDSDSASDGSCPTGSNTLVCMQASVKEGDNGQWFILPDVIINKSTAPSSNPYQVELVVTDSGGKTGTGTIPVYVGTGEDVTDQQVAPRAIAAIPTSPTSIEILFNKELSANSVSASGKGFKITSSSSTSDVLAITGATINPSGNVVTLSTANQMSAKAYTLSVNNEIRDLVGQSVVEGAANRLSFTGFKSLGTAPILEYISATASNTIELEFRENLKPSSVRMGTTDLSGGSQFGVNIYESENSSKSLNVYGVTLLNPGNILRITTAAQSPNMKYRLNLEGLESYDGSSVLSSINKGFKGFDTMVVQHLAAANSADLNADGRVDFSDFTIFSSVYGTVYFGTTQTSSDSQSGLPIQSNPDATVPITSEPAGGEIQ